MSPTAVRALIVAGALLVLAGVNYSIVGKEQVIRSGETIFLELVPVDPRSLMQGDYMALRFRLSEEVETARANATLAADVRAAPLRLDERGVATLGANGSDVAIGFRIRNGRVWLGTNAYFFAEGAAERYTGARYGEFRLRRADGEAVLVGLADENLNRR
jgi:uncharacterized membrane-anchored protein